MPAPHRILILTTSEGHTSIALAARDALQGVASKKLRTFPEPVFHLYKLFYRYNPQLFSIVYNSFSKPSVDRVVRAILILSYRRKLEREIARYKPTVVMSTGFGFTPALTLLQSKYQFHFINIIPNPRTFFYQDVARAALNLTFDQTHFASCQAVYPAGKYFTTGWLVQDKFETPYDKTQVRSQLKIAQTDVVVLIVSGSEGMLNVAELTQRLLSQSISRNCTVIVACGSSTKLVKKLHKLAKKPPANTNITLQALAFTHELQLYMQAADVIVGKAGPNSLFEAVATKTPFIATAHMSGLEDGNLDIIKEYKVGVVEENTEKAAKLLASYIDHPEKLAAFQPALEQLARYNQAAKNKLLTLIASL